MIKSLTLEDFKHLLTKATYPAERLRILKELETWEEDRIRVEATGLPTYKTKVGRREVLKLTFRYDKKLKAYMAYVYVMDLGPKTLEWIPWQHLHKDQG